MVKKIRPGFDPAQLLRQFENRGFSLTEVTERVAEILDAVARRGDEAVCEFTRKFDRTELKPSELKVPASEIEIADRVLSPDLVAAIELAVERIRHFHEMQRQKSWYAVEAGGMLGQQIQPIERVGVYAPGGTAVLFSTAIMNIIPAQVAGCDRIAVTSPPQPSLEGALSPTILAVCHVLGQKELYRVGGAQAIAALALGTETIEKMDMLCGPGNIYVTEAKRQLQGKVRIDSLAGPTEVVIIADEKARADYIAADLLAQLEHDTAAASMLLTPSEKLIEAVDEELQRQRPLLKRSEILSKSIEHNCYLVQTRNLDEAFELSNQLAPEHLELLVENASSLARLARNAGAIFLGDFAPEAVGDYVAGPNHVLPTGRTARFSSGLSVDDFIKKSNLVYFDRKGFQLLAEAAMVLAEAEGLDGHANSIRVRL